jgi:hypothetical protein
MLMSNNLLNRSAGGGGSRALVQLCRCMQTPFAACVVYSIQSGCGRLVGGGAEDPRGACLGVYSSGWLLLVLLVWFDLVGCGSYLGSAEGQQRALALIFAEAAVQYLCWPGVLHAERLQPLSYEGVGSE